MYHWIVYLLRRRLGVPLLVSIAVGIGAYIALAAMAQLLSDLPFKWAATGFVGLWAITAPLYRASHEPPHRSLAPIYIKTPTIFVIALAVYSMTRMLGGAVATFPFGGMFTSYEMRKSLFTLAGQYTINVISFGLMIIVMWLLQDRLTAPWPMILGVATLMATMLVIHAVGWGEPVVEGRP